MTPANSQTSPSWDDGGPHGRNSWSPGDSRPSWPAEPATTPAMPGNQPRHPRSSHRGAGCSETGQSDSGGDVGKGSAQRTPRQRPLGLTQPGKQPRGSFMRGDQAGERQSKVVLIAVAMIGSIRLRSAVMCVIPARRSSPRLDFGGPPSDARRYRRKHAGSPPGRRRHAPSDCGSRCSNAPGSNR
jgi:hypothetical protein